MKKELAEIKLEIITKAVESGKMSELNSSGFFKTYDQIERSNKLSVGSRIWLGRMLKLVFEKSAPNPGNIAIFQEPKQFKKIRQFEQKQKKNG